MSKLKLQCSANKESKLIIYETLKNLDVIELLAINDEYDDINQLFITKDQAIQLINHLKTQFSL